MNKFMPFMLIFFFISGSFAATINPVSAKLVENSWSTKTPMNQARDFLGVVTVDNKIYAIGGGHLTSNERYDSKTNTWTTLMPMPTPRTYLAIAAYQGKIYCISDELVGVTEVYDIATNSWSTKAPIPHSRGGGVLQAHVIEEQIFVINVSIFRLFIYDPNTDSWTEKPSIPVNIATSAYNLVSTLVGDKIIVIGSFFVGESFNLTMEKSCCL